MGNGFAPTCGTQALVLRRVWQHFAWAGALPVAFITGELVSPHALRNFAGPFVLLRKSEVSRFVAAQQPTGFDHVRDP
jgi:hypothetical protein